MPNKKNQQLVLDFKEMLDQSAGVIFVNYQGLANTQLELLRNSVEEHGGSLNITKNTLIKIIVNKKSTGPNKQVPDETLSGPTASIFFKDDPIAPIKVLTEFIKTNELPVIKGGLLDNKYLAAIEIDRLSKLPSHEELIIKTIWQIQAPLYGLVNVLSGNIRQLVTVLSEIQKNPVTSTKNVIKGGDSGGE